MTAGSRGPTEGGLIRAAYVLAMRLMQSPLWDGLDDEERAAATLAMHTAQESVCNRAGPWGTPPTEAVSDALALIRRALAMRDYGDQPVLWEHVWSDIEEAAHRLGSALAVGAERSPAAVATSAAGGTSPLDLRAVEASLPPPTDKYATKRERDGLALLAYVRALTSRLESSTHVLDAMATLAGDSVTRELAALNRDRNRVVLGAAQDGESP